MGSMPEAEISISGGKHTTAILKKDSTEKKNDNNFIVNAIIYQ